MIFIHIMIKLTLCRREIKPLNICLTMLFRTQTMANIISLAAKTLPPSEYYPYGVALVGPIVVGTTLGSFGQFIPLDKGMSPVAAGTPWPIQV